ncbi:GNAT family N-acetyltransferase [Diplogelasinospora grovesii]|uniref:GNAT family N-acetyltransferase n=1 Tax=Diplogelasinospora grovesii TaxID=303347 RepID=A0AAN6NI14_9PEZI|nr:GNAT family N-acetyltransferase [Diplogelasinospora grovesii]
MAADSSSSRPDIKKWSRPLAENRLYTISTDRNLVQLDALNAAFGSDLLWWAKPLADDEMLKRMLDNSLCFGLYVQQCAVEVDGVPLMTKPKMIGFARVITDYVTFGYLTDVYVLPDYQGKGLGRWMMACLNEYLDSGWPELRRFMLLTSSDPAAVRIYNSTLGARDIRETDTRKLVVMEKLGPAGVFKSKHP